MDDLMRFFEEVLKFFKMPMTVYGFTFSFCDAAEAGGEEQGNEVPAAPADGEGQEQQISEITGTVTVDNLWERPIMSTPLSQYTVTEGLLLLCFLLVLVRTLFRIWNN